MFTFDESSGILRIRCGGRPFAEYAYSGYPKPHLGHILNADGISFTRDDEHNPEHPHQRAIITGIGEVTLAGHETLDFWNEPDGCGVILHRGFDFSDSGFVSRCVWQSPDGTPYLDERRGFEFSEAGGAAILDLTITLSADYGEIVFGATKEAGPLGIRVADELRGDRGGMIENAEGLTGEAGCWGKCSAWCRYSGLPGGKPASITVADDMRNERYPTAWHVRDYGLFAANNLFFKGGYTLPAGESAVYRYRITFA